MSDKSYPVPYFKDLHQPKSAHSPKEEKILREDGWNADRHAIPHQEYPKTLYSRTGHTVTVGKYPTDGGPIDLEAARADEAARIAEGYSVAPVPKREVAKLPDDLVVSPSKSAAIAEQNGRIDNLEERVDQIADGMNQILEFIRSQQSKPTGKKKQPETEEAPIV